MFELPGYRLGEPLLETTGLLYYRAIREEDERDVLVKALKAPRPTFIDKANFKNEFRVTRSLKSPCIFKPLAIDVERNRCALVTENFSGRPAEPADFWDRFGCEGFLRLALQAAETLREAHDHNVIHHNPRPSHLWIDGASLSLKMTGFLASSPREEQLGEARHQEYLEALTYMSPEQTGRLNRVVDHYSDLYGLGLSFYELLTGAPPFTEKDAMTLVHCHLAREPRPPCQGNPEVPRQLSDIVVKLLNKTPEDRYHGASGLVSDLSACLEQWAEKGRLRRFALGSKDVSRRFQVSRKLYGRHKQYESLGLAVKAACAGHPRFLPVAAPSGMGKSTLVRRFFRHQSVLPGYYVAGNFANRSQSVPYRGLFQAFRELVSQILTENAASLADWRSNLLSALGDHLHALLEVVPEVSWIIGEPPGPYAGGSAESQNRFRLAILRFIGIFAKHEHPLVIFLDDLQWADLADFSLIQDLFHQGGNKHFLVIGAYRPEKLATNHPLIQMFSDLDKQGVALAPLSLEPLDLIHIQELTRDTLGRMAENPKPLAEFLLQKTGGNPFFVRFLMRSLFIEGVIRFDKQRGCWSYAAESEAFSAISRKSLTRLILDRVQRLSSRARQLLEVAACFGNQFPLNLLAEAAEFPLAEAAAKLAEAVEDEILIPSGEAYKLLRVYDPAEIEALGKWKLGVSYHFHHDRIRGAIYEGMAPEQSEIFHRKLGSLLLKEERGSKPRGRLFDAANQMNKGQKLLRNPADRVNLARLNLAAGEKAKNAMAFQHARGYFRSGLDLLSQEESHVPRDLWFNLHLHLAETEYLAGQPETGELQFANLASSAEGTSELARVFGTKLLLMNNLGRLEDAVQAGLEGLARLGIEPPRKRDLLIGQTREWLHAVLARLQAEGLDSLLALPISEDERVNRVNQLLMYSVAPAYNTDQPLFKWLALFHIRHVFEFGRTPYAPHAVAVLGILAGESGDTATGFELGQTAIQMNRRLPNPHIEYKLEFIGCNLLNHWRRRLKKDLSLTRHVFEKAMAHGDLVYANYSLLVHSMHLWLLNRPLLTILDESERHAAFASMTRNQMALETQRYLSHAVLNLRGLTKDARVLDSESFTESECLARLREMRYFTGLSWAYILKMQVLYLRGFNEKALATAREGESFIAYNQNTLIMPAHYFFKALILARALMEKGTGEAKAREELAACSDLFRTWAASCPENYEHQRDLIEAEVARLDGDPWAALKGYGAAKERAAEQGFPLYAAIADERAASLLMEFGLESYARGHLLSALETYEAWGATAKRRDLERVHAAPLGKLESPIDRPALGSGPEPGLTASGGGHPDALDMATLVEAAGAISGEIKLDALYTKMLRLAVENAGAQRGVLILKEQGKLVQVAQWRVEEDQVRLLDSIPLEAAGDMALTAVNYVLRTRSDLVLRSGDRDSRWDADPYLRTSGVRALACIPIIRQTEPLAILYLEHGAIAEAFHRHRLRMLRLLAPQIGIAIENARFIANMAYLNQTLRAEIGERKKAERALKKAQAIALLNERNAGKAEFANSVLHNIKNVLNSVLISCDEVSGMVERSRLDSLQKASDLLLDNRQRLSEFLQRDPKGIKLPEFLQQLTEVLLGERESLRKEVAELSKRMSLIQEIIQTQQAFAKDAARFESIDLVLAVEEVLRMQADAIETHRIEVVRDFQEDEPVRGNAVQLSHILINLVKNAVEAMSAQKKRILLLSTGKSAQGAVYLDISDTGSGITEQEKENLFNHGFTTKDDGHGFGLHYCAHAMKEMGGNIRVASEGRHKGATFRLSFAAGSLSPSTDS